MTDPHFKTKMYPDDEAYLNSPEGEWLRGKLQEKADRHGVPLAFVANMKAAGAEGSQREGFGKEYRVIMLGATA